MDGLTIPDDLEEQFRAHLNRGVLLLSQRVKHMSDLTRLVEESQLGSVIAFDASETEEEL